MSKARKLYYGRKDLDGQGPGLSRREPTFAEAEALRKQRALENSTARRREMLERAEEEEKMRESIRREELKKVIEKAKVVTERVRQIGGRLHPKDQLFCDQALQPTECDQCGLCCATGACSYGRCMETSEHDYRCGFLRFRDGKAVCLGWDKLEAAVKKDGKCYLFVKEEYLAEEGYRNMMEELKKGRDLTGWSKFRLDWLEFGLKLSRMVRAPFGRLAHAGRRRRALKWLAQQRKSYE